MPLDLPLDDNTLDTVETDDVHLGSLLVDKVGALAVVVAIAPYGE